MAENTPQQPDDSESKKPPEAAKPTRAVQIPTPIPDDDLARQDDDDVAVDFRHMPAEAGGSSALSHSQISGPLSGTSVVDWAQLMKEQAEDQAKQQYDSSDIFDAAKQQRTLEDQASSILSEAEVSSLPDSSKINLLKDQTAADFEVVSDDESPESSAVDLGSQPVVDLPYPIEGSSGSGGTKTRSGRKRALEDSGQVDLISDDVGSGLTAVGSGLRPDSGMPSTKPLGVMPSRSTGWIGGGLIGGLTGIALCVAVWLSGALNGTKTAEPGPQPAPQQPLSNGSDATLAVIRDAIQQAKLDPADPVAAFTKLVEDKNTTAAAIQKAETDKKAVEDERKAAQAQMKEINAQLTATQQNARTFENLQKTAEDKLKAAKAQVDEAKDMQKRAEEERKKLDDDLKAVRAQLAGGKPAPAGDTTEQARLKEEREQLNAKVKELETQLAANTRNSESLQRTIRDLGGFVVAVRQKLQAPPDSKPAEILTALDTTLAAKPIPELGPLPPGTSTTDPRADRAFHRGLNLYRAGNYADAEREFRTATTLQNRDARYWYFLGLAQNALGQSTKADESFRQGLDREQRNLPSPDAVDAMFERMPARDRGTINRVRGRG